MSLSIYHFERDELGNSALPLASSFLLATNAKKIMSALAIESPRSLKNREDPLSSDYASGSRLAALRKVCGIDALICGWWIGGSLREFQCKSFGVI